MKNDNLEAFVRLRRELMQEKEQLSRRLTQINEALGDMPMPSLSASEGAAVPEEESEEEETAAPAPAAKRGPGRGRRAAGGSGGSLREHVMEVLRSGPKTKEEVLQAVQKRGYKFSTNNPLNSLGVILYGKNPKFERVNGKFSIPGAGKGAGKGR